MTTEEIVTLVISGIALVFSYTSYQKTKSLTLYQDLDSQYFDLLSLAMEYPDFVKPEFTREYKTKFSGKDITRYELYAFMVWNICETIFERKSNKEFYNTWGCIIQHENSLHRSWFDAAENESKFKPAFRKFIQKIK